MGELKEAKINWEWITRDHDIEPEKVVDIELLEDTMGVWLVIVYE